MAQTRDAKPARAPFVTRAHFSVSLACGASSSIGLCDRVRCAAARALSIDEKVCASVMKSLVSQLSCLCLKDVKKDFKKSTNSGENQLDTNTKFDVDEGIFAQAWDIC